MGESSYCIVRRETMLNVCGLLDPGLFRALFQQFFNERNVGAGDENTVDPV